jgi:hypothetical protein
VITAIGFSGGFYPDQMLIQTATLDLAAHCFAVRSNGRIIDATLRHGVAERSRNDIAAAWIKLIPAVKIMTLTESIQLEMWLHDRIGKKYDKGFVLGWPFFGRKWQADDEYCCSELIGAGLVAVGALEIPTMHRLTSRNLRRRVEEKSLDYRINFKGAK